MSDLLAVVGRVDQFVSVDDVLGFVRPTGIDSHPVAMSISQYSGFGLFERWIGADQFVVVIASSGDYDVDGFHGLSIATAVRT